MLFYKTIFLIMFQHNNTKNGYSTFSYNNPIFVIVWILSTIVKHIAQMPDLESRVRDQQICSELPYMCTQIIYSQ